MAGGLSAPGRGVLRLTGGGCGLSFSVSRDSDSTLQL